MATKAAKNLSSPDVVRAAIDVLDDVGLDGLTMRLVAKRLGVQLNTVYWHATSKPELLEMVADALLAGCVDDSRFASWQERLSAVLRRYRHALLTHRDGARVVAGTYSVMENTLALSEELTRTFLDAGFSDQMATWATWHSSALVLGLVLEQQNEPEDWAQRLRFGVDADQHPSVQVATDHHVAGDHDARFEFSCDLTIRGLDSLLREVQ
jgi:TetR/AcrR family transcriptional regulator, tetracycline repressor protein